MSDFTLPSWTIYSDRYCANNPDCHSMFKNAILTRSKNSYCPLDNTLIYFAYSTGCEMFTQQGTHCTGQSDGPDQRAYSETCPQVVAEHSSQT